VGNEKNSGLITHTQVVRTDTAREITSFHVTMGYWDDDDLTALKVQAFLKVRPDGVGFN